MKRFNLQGRTALLTGSYRGLGVVLARGLADAGATVVLNGRNSQALSVTVSDFKAEGYDVYGFPFDVTDETQIDDAITKIEKQVGPIDILINNAGVQKRAPLHEFPTEDWQAIINTHLTGAFFVSRRVVGGMIDRKRGKIINICSTVSEVGRQGIGPYTAAKGGLRMLTRAMCADWGCYNIQANGIAPGYFITEMTRSMADNPKFNDWVVDRTPAGRWGKPDELIGVLLLLASDESSFINGQIIVVDGGVLATM